MSLFSRLFRTHPQSVDETYLEHMNVAFSFSGRLFRAALCAFVHGLVPGLFETTASRTIRELHGKMSNRHAPATVDSGSAQRA